MSKRFKIKNVAISITNLDDAAQQIFRLADNQTPNYVCAACVRSIYFGNHDPIFCRILNDSYLTVPDGKPLVWHAHLAGFRQVKRTSGPDLFERICKLSHNTNYTHFLYGSTPEVIEKMQKNLINKYPKIKIVGAVSPPFCPVEELANKSIIEQINKTKPTFVWIGLGAPKQEHFIDLIIDKIESSILVGVGLAFDYQAGTIKRAPKWMQKTGLEGFYRDFQQPHRINVQSYIRLFSIIPLLLNACFKKNIQ